MHDTFQMQPLTYAVEHAWTPHNSGTSSRLEKWRQSQRAASNHPPADEDDDDAVALPAPPTSAPAAKVRSGATDPLPTWLTSSAAVAAERKRMAEVFASEHSRGRERGCAALLTSEEGWTAAAIVAELPNLPMDGATNSAAGRARTDARWSRAYGHKAEPVAAEQGKSSNDRWARANAKIGRSA